MFRILIIVVSVTPAQFSDNADSSNIPNGWLENLKKRLMADNYDYLPSSDDLEPRAMDNGPSKPATDTTTETTTTPVYYDLLDAEDKDPPELLIYDSTQKNINEKDDVLNYINTIQSFYTTSQRTHDVYFVPRVPQNSIDERDDDHGISRNDLEAYLKDAKKQDSIETRNVSYKVIQPSWLARRAGSAAPRFVEEFGATGFSLLSVDGAPFPEFQLPSARRQYQAVKDSASEDWLD